MPTVLERHRETWYRKKILRIIYTEWYRMIISDLADLGGKTVELGAGSGNFKEFKPDVISADIEPSPWLDMCFDAHDMPFEDSTLSNIVMIDVLHHLDHPLKFLNEAWRVLQNRGRLIILEPYPSLVSLMIYRKFHPEPFIMDQDYFQNEDEVRQKDPWDSNQAAAWLLFYKNREKFHALMGEKFNIIIKRRMSCILYPLSGGFENRALIPDFMIPFFRIIEFLATPFRRWVAFRTYIVVEKAHKVKS